MYKLTRCLLAGMLLWLTAPCGSEPLTIGYSVRPVPAGEQSAGALHLGITVSGLRDQKSIRFQMPVWSPGDYHVMNHAQYVREVTATVDSGQAASVQHPDANTWEVDTTGHNTLVLNYLVPTTPPGYFSENVRVAQKWAFYNGPAAYMYVEGHKQDPATLQIVAPPGWGPPVTPLSQDRAEAVPGQETRYLAPDYDTLADSPVAMGDISTRDFTVAGKRHTVLLMRNFQGVDTDPYVPVLEKIVAEENRLMGGPPYQRYVFFFDVGGPGGGLEHGSATRIGIGKRLPPRFLAGMAAHEFFHLWNVKRLRPSVLGPFDYIHPPHTRSLWFSEGVTSDYGDLSVRRAGLSTEQEYLRELAASIGALQSNPARKRVTADEASLRVWESNTSEGFGGLSYYLKGELIGLCLDLKIRALTENRASLDDVMRDMFGRYGLPKPGFPEDGIRDAAIRAAGVEMGPFYDLLARSTEEVPFQQVLAYAGLKLVETPPGHFAIEQEAGASKNALAIRAAWLTGRSAP